ncbi:hypothetical protein EJC49_14385 [Aquibium carbonis]|uniref:Uncharacterized protein n=1 Tax=Aquibium carbonis TaxID=2495581 RepID=A0A429YW87_9HYPH|nr:hypothetical protein EJC49_14385 [Aquibium carbonis]
MLTSPDTLRRDPSVDSSGFKDCRQSELLFSRASSNSDVLHRLRLECILDELHDLARATVVAASERQPSGAEIVDPERQNRLAAASAAMPPKDRACRRAYRSTMASASISTS